MKTRAFKILVQRNNSEEIINKVYEVIIKNHNLPAKLLNDLISYLAENPSVKLARKIAEDFQRGKLPEQIWGKIKAPWGTVLLNEALKSSNLIYKDKPERDLLRFKFVVEVLSIMCHKQIFTVLNTFIENSKNKNDYTQLNEIVNSLEALPLAYSEEVLNILSLLIVNDYGPSKEFKSFSDRVYLLVKKFGVNSQAGKKFRESLEKVKSARWLENKQRYLELLEKISKSGNK